MTDTKKTKKASTEKLEEQVKTDPKQMEVSAAQAIQAYFTKDINDQVHNMTNDVMFTLLRQLEGSEYWIAILRYNNLRLLNCQSALNTLDPISQGSEMRRQQGVMVGLVDLQNAIIQLVEIQKAAAEEAAAISETFA